MKKLRLFVALALCILLSACTVVHREFGVCRHRTLYTLAVAGDKYPVRALYGISMDEEFSLVQGQALVNGQWLWLELSYEGYVNFSTEPDKYWKEGNIRARFAIGFDNYLDLMKAWRKR